MLKRLYEQDRSSRAAATAFIATALLSPTALSLTVLTYPASMCVRWRIDTNNNFEECREDGRVLYETGTARATQTSVLSCPVVRDDNTTTVVPRLAVEFYNSGAGSTVTCNMEWTQEDLAQNSSSDLDTFRRGYFQNKSTTSTGFRELSFGSADPTTGTASLTSGGEGTISIRCSIGAGDRLLHYQVTEGS